MKPYSLKIAYYIVDDEGQLVCRAVSKEKAMELLSELNRAAEAANNNKEKAA
jgi:hypothetical protein